jgi:hypothetical protein
VETLSQYKEWSGFEVQIGRYISQLVTEIEQEQF